MRQLLQERWAQTLAAAIETSSNSTRVAFSVAIGVAGFIFVLLVLWKLRRKLGCCSRRAEQAARQDVLRLAAELYGKEQRCESPPRLHLPPKLRNAALAQPDTELRIKAARLPSAHQLPTAFQQPQEPLQPTGYWGVPLAIQCGGTQPCSPVGPLTRQCREEGSSAARSTGALVCQHSAKSSSGCTTPRAGGPPTSVQGGSSAASPQASCSATLSDSLSQGTLPAASPRARSPPTAPASPLPPCTDAQQVTDASPALSSPGLTWAELGVSQPSSPTASSSLETRLHRLASYLRGAPAERGPEPHQPGGPSRLHSRLGDHGLSYASSPESASQWVLSGSHQTSSMYTGAKKPPALPSPPWLDMNGGHACGSTSRQWLLGLEEGAEEGRG